LLKYLVSACDESWRYNIKYNMCKCCTRNVAHRTIPRIFLLSEPAAVIGISSVIGFPGTFAPAGRFFRMWMRRTLFIWCVLTAASDVAGAQAPPATTPPAQTAPPQPATSSASCTPMHPVPQQGTAALEGTTGQRAESLGDKLARSDGVLCPPAGIDPEIRAPTPDTGNTPVIPPPGTPGGDSNVRPK
jgi:hypothetical protein